MVKVSCVDFFDDGLIRLLVFDCNYLIIEFILFQKLSKTLGVGVSTGPDRHTGSKSGTDCV